MIIEKLNILSNSNYNEETYVKFIKQDYVISSFFTLTGYFNIYNLSNKSSVKNITENSDWTGVNFDILKSNYICYIDNYKKVVVIFDIKNMKVYKEVSTSTKKTFDILSVYDENNIVVFDESSDYGEIRLININNNNIKTFISNDKLDKGGNSIVCLPLKGLILSTHTEYINIWSVQSKNIIKKLKHCSISLAISSDNKFLASASLENSEDIYIYNIDSWEHIKTLNGMDQDQKTWLGHHSCEYVCFSPNGKYVAVTYFQKIKIFDFETGEVVYRNFCKSKNVSFSEDGKLICFNDGDGLKLFEFGFP